MSNAAASLLIFVLAYVLISARRLPFLRLNRPAASLAGAVLMVVCTDLTLEGAFEVVNWHTITLLLGMIGGQALQNFLFKVNTLDPVIYAAVAALLSAVAAASCFVPARRATRVNPIIALRAE